MTQAVEVVEVFLEVKSASTPKHTEYQKAYIIKMSFERHFKKSFQSDPLKSVKILKPVRIL